VVLVESTKAKVAVISGSRLVKAKSAMPISSNAATTMLKNEAEECFESTSFSAMTYF
jgi:hypothetical protein